MATFTAMMAALHGTPLLLDSEIDEASYSQVGRSLLELAGRIGRREAAVAAVEVFRTALIELPGEPSFQNGLGAALIELARLEPHVAALSALTEAYQQFAEARASVIAQGAPPAVSVRYEINLAMVSWMLGERLGEPDKINAAIESLRSTLTQLERQTVDWPRAQEILGNILIAQKKPTEARAVYQAIEDIRKPRGRTDKKFREKLAERGRLLTDIGITYAAAGNYTKARQIYRDALALQPLDYVPLAWGRVQNNLGMVLLQEALASRRSPRNADLIRRAIQAFRAARDTHEHLQASLDWAVITVGLANALLSYGTHLCLPGPEADRTTGTDNIEQALALFRGTFLSLTPPHLGIVLNNLQVAFQVLAQISADQKDRAKFREQVLEVIILRLMYYKSCFEYNFSSILHIVTKLLPMSDRISTGMGKDADQVISDIKDILASSGLPETEWPGILRTVIQRVSPSQAPSLPDEAARETTGRTKRKPRAQAETVEPHAGMPDTEAVKLVFGDIPESFQTGTYTRNPRPDLVYHPAVLAQAKEIVSANSRTKIADLAPQDRETLRQARRVVRANERRPGG
jgi:tetratricopeptide (TPR) repeat protein